MTTAAQQKEREKMQKWMVVLLVLIFSQAAAWGQLRHRMSHGQRLLEEDRRLSGEVATLPVSGKRSQAFELLEEVIALDAAILSNELDQASGLDAGVDRSTGQDAEVERETLKAQLVSDRATKRAWLLRVLRR
jgi:biopolymer transport protein ExbB/TolQ